MAIRSAPTASGHSVRTVEASDGCRLRPTASEEEPMRCVLDTDEGRFGGHMREGSQGEMGWSDFLDGIWIGRGERSEE